MKKNNALITIYKQYKEYDLINIPLSIIIEECEKECLKSDDFNMENTLEYLNCYLSEHINKILLDDNKYVETINDFVLKNLKLSKTHNTAVKQIKKLIYWHEKMNVEINIDKLKDIIIKNSFLAILVKKIKINLLEDTLENYLLLSLISDEEIVEDEIDTSKLYLNNAFSAYRSYEVLTKEEEYELFEKYRNGDEAAKEKIINSNLKLVMKIANRYFTNEVDDAIQNGIMHLIKLVEKFDHKLDSKFSGYAYHAILRAMRREVKPIIHIPENIEISLRKIFYIKNVLKDQLFREPTNEELAEKLGITPKKLNKLLNTSFQIISSEEEIKETSNVKISDKFIYDAHLEENIDNELLNEKLEKMLSSLKKREQMIMKLRYGFIDGEVWLLKEIGELYNISKERVRQIEKKSLTKLRDSSDVFLLSEFLSDEKKILNQLQEFKIPKKIEVKSSIYSYFEDYNIDDVDELISQLSIKDIFTIQAKLGYIEGEFSPRIVSNRFTAIVKRLKKNLDLRKIPTELIIDWNDKIGNLQQIYLEEDEIIEYRLRK